MNLIEFDKENYAVIYSPLLLTLSPFKKIIQRDKSKNKETAIKEISFVAFFSDIRSNYMYIVDENERVLELIKDLELPKDWKVDNIIKEAISFYLEKSTTVNSSIYKSACKSAIDISNYLNKTNELLEERDKNRKVVTDISKITSALEKVPKIMANLNAAHTELIKEQKITEGRTKGKKTFNMFEDGLGYDDDNE